jgi:DNA polymerase III subunit epsilon
MDDHKVRAASDIFRRPARRPPARGWRDGWDGVAAAEMSGGRFTVRSVISLGVAAPAPAELEAAGTDWARDIELATAEFVVVDLETTGWSPHKAAITEIGAVRVKGVPGRVNGIRRGEFASLVHSGVPVPPPIAELTRISDVMLATAPGLSTVLPRLLDFAAGSVLVAHNAPFDIGFLRAACEGCGLAWPGFTVLDTVMLARRLMDPDEIPDCKLGTLAGFFGAQTEPTHRALADARATAHVLGWLIRRLTHIGVRTVDELRVWPHVVA